MNSMRAFRSALASIIILVVLGAVPAYSWHGTGIITALVVASSNPNILYARTGGADVFDRRGFKSTDGGATWSATGLTDVRVTALAIDPQDPSIVYAGTEGDGVFKSADGGGSWLAINTGLTGFNVADLIIDPGTPATLYAMTPGAVFKSVDGGANWSAILWPDSYNDISTQSIAALAMDPQNPAILYAAFYYCLPLECWNDLVKSTDGGATWELTALLYLGDYAELAIAPQTSQTPATVYAVGFGHGTVYKSTDGGASWIELTICPSRLAIDPLNPTTLYAGTGGGVFKSTDEGVTWSAVNTGLTDILVAYGVGPGVGQLAIDPGTPTTVYAGTSLGVFKSTDGATNWSPTGLIQHSPLVSVSLNPTSVTGGTASTGTVTLITAAPADGAAVTLSSSNTAVATVPASVTVAAGTTSADFTVSTSAVTASTTVMISAAFDDAIRRAHLNVNVPTTLSSVSLSPTSVTGGTASTGYVSLTTAAPADGAVVTLSSSDPPVATVPDSVTVAAGAWNANFPISTGAVSSSTAVTISGTYGDVTKSATLTVTPSDTEPPDTSITSAVDGNGVSVPNDGVTLSNAITVAFTGTDNVEVAGFECRLDGASFAPCTSPVTYGGLAVGRHAFEVRAVDTSDNRDGTPAFHTWTVDSPPETTITSAVDGQGKEILNGGSTRSNMITFSFTGTDNGSVTGFECSLDGAAFTACTSPITYKGVSKGQHTFQVWAIDNNGFRDPTPATFTWTRS